jgi:hypothetical protein
MRKSLIKGLAASVGIFALIALAAGPTAFALHSGSHYSLFGDASYVSPGEASNRGVKLVSDAEPGYAGINYPVESGTTFADIQELSTSYMFETDDSCAAGAPRFQIRVQTESGARNIFAYFGTAPNYNECPSGVWTDTTDLLEADKLVDTSQLAGGTFYDPYSAALAKYGSLPVISIQLVTDSGWAAADGEQTVKIDNTVVDTTLFTYEPTGREGVVMCKNSGWQTMMDDEGNMFKNHGDCVSFFSTNGKNKAAN